LHRQQERLIKLGVPSSSIIQVTTTFFNVLKKSLGFQIQKEDLPVEKTVEDVMKDFYSKNQKNMNKFCQRNFRKLIIQSKVWSK
jgi:hypothetical protein